MDCCKGGVFRRSGARLLFHRGQAVMRKCCGPWTKDCIRGVTYLPPGQIRGAFVNLRQFAIVNLRQFANTPPLRQLLQYVEETWINSDVRGICEWSVFQLAVRTDNDVEGTYIQYDQFLCNFINV